MKNSFQAKAYVEVTLQTRSKTWLQSHEFEQMPRQDSKTILPFFYERNETKDYFEKFSLRASFPGSDTGGRSLYGSTSGCNIGTGNGGSVWQLIVYKEGFTLNGVGKTCTGKWESKKNAVDEAEEEL
jgi:hypothetical protein